MIEFANEITEEQMREAESHACKLKCRASLDKQLAYLDQYGSLSWTQRDVSKCVIGPDYAPHSFTFCIFMRKRDEEGNPVGDFSEQPLLHGGLIFHPGNTGPDESLSVELSPQSAPHWSIHT